VNLNTWSEDLTNAAWSKLSATVSSNQTTAPDWQPPQQIRSLKLQHLNQHYAHNTGGSSYIWNDLHPTRICKEGNRINGSKLDFNWISVFWIWNSSRSIQFGHGIIRSVYKYYRIKCNPVFKRMVEGVDFCCRNRNSYCWQQLYNIHKQHKYNKHSNLHRTDHLGCLRLGRTV